MTSKQNEWQTKIFRLDSYFHVCTQQGKYVRTRSITLYSFLLKNEVKNQLLILIEQNVIDVWKNEGNVIYLEWVVWLCDNNVT